MWLDDGNEFCHKGLEGQSRRLVVASTPTLLRIGVHTHFPQLARAGQLGLDRVSEISVLI